MSEILIIRLKLTLTVLQVIYFFQKLHLLSTYNFTNCYKCKYTRAIILNMQKAS